MVGWLGLAWVFIFIFILDSWGGGGFQKKSKDGSCVLGFVGGVNYYLSLSYLPTEI